MQVAEEGVIVLFACKCMTYDESETKFWFHGEYEPLNIGSVEEKLEQHAAHCPYGEAVVALSSESFKKGTINEIKTWTEIL